MGFVVLTSDGCVSHVKMPLVELTLAPGGAPGSRLNASVLVGISESDAELVNVTAMPVGGGFGGKFVLIEPLVVAGLDLARMAFEERGPTLKFEHVIEDGTQLKKGDALLSIRGNARAILEAERVALNFVQRLSGIATLTLTRLALDITWPEGHQSA